MAELQRDEPGLQGVRRILKEWIADAAQSIHKQRVTDADIHDARKQLKKSRAALRLLRDAIGEVAYERENAALRDAARPLGVARDSKVLIATLDDLGERYAPATRSIKLDKFRRALRQDQREAKQAITITLMNRQRKALREVALRSDRWRMKGEDWPTLAAGLERSYRSGKKKMRTAARSRDSEHLHAWRKQVKYLWHQLQILEPVWPGMLGELADQAHKLAEYLGDDHDLSVLRQKLSANAATLNAQDRDALIALLERRRRQLQDNACKLGRKIFQERPQRFSGRMGKYWRAWRAEK